MGCRKPLPQPCLLSRDLRYNQAGQPHLLGRAHDRSRPPTQDVPMSGHASLRFHPCPDPPAPAPKCSSQKMFRAPMAVLRFRYLGHPYEVISTLEPVPKGACVPSEWLALRPGRS